MPVIKWLGKILSWTLIVVVVAAGALLLVNAVDEDLNPETAAALKPTPPRVPEQENGFFAIVGFHAPAGEDPHARGRRWLAEVSSASADQMREIKNRQEPERLDFKGIRGRICRLESESCIETVRRDAAGVRRLVEVNAVLLRRYESLYRYPRLEEVFPARADAPIPAIAAILTAQDLKLAQIALLIEAGRIADALDGLQRDLTLHRRLAAGSSSLIYLVIANVALSKDYLFLADILRSKRGELMPHAARISDMSVPPGIAAMGLERVLDTEFRFAASTTRLAKDGRMAEVFGTTGVGVLNAFSDQTKVILGESRGLAFLDPFVLPFLKERATINMMQPYYQRQARLSRAPAGRLREESRALREQAQRDVYNWRIVYNPLGKLLVVRGVEAGWTDYSYRLHDVEGLARLVALQAQIVSQGLPEAGIPQFLAASDKKLFDPYTDKPMQWDAAARQLWFAPQGEKARRDRIGGREGRIAVGL